MLFTAHMVARCHDSNNCLNFKSAIHVAVRVSRTAYSFVNFTLIINRITIVLSFACMRKKKKKMYDYYYCQAALLRLDVPNNARLITKLICVKKKICTDNILIKIYEYFFYCVYF